MLFKVIYFIVILLHCILNYNFNDGNNESVLDISC